MNKKNITELFNELKNENQIFLNYLRAKFPLFHNSNFFHADFEYGIIGFLEKKGIFINYKEAKELSTLLAGFYEKSGVLVKINNQTWRVNYPDFTTTKPGDPFSY